jgi:hypothetical protein
MTIVVTRKPPQRREPVEEEECPHGLGSPSWCSICLHGPTFRHVDVTVVARFRAKYRSTCSGCDFSIEPGQRVTKLSTGALFHDYCEP